MDHIWEAPSRLKKLLVFLFLKKLAIILRQDFLRTLYISVFMINVEVSGASAGSLAAVAILIDDIDIGDIIAEAGMNNDSELQELLPVISSICVSRPDEGHLAHFPPHLISTNICLTVCSTISRNMFTKL